MGKTKSPNGYEIYAGPSLIDGGPIVVIATLESSNSGTGDMVQTWILRQDHDPLYCSRHGLDVSICGRCGHRGKPTYAARGQAKDRSCYVVLITAPLNIWKSWRRGLYPKALGHVAIAALGRGRKVRLGAYGDMSAVPSYVAESLISECDGHTAYSHQTGMPQSSFDPSVYMVSADSLGDAQSAWDLGYRTFRVIADVTERTAGEMLCPKSAEAKALRTDHREVRCVDCMACGGTASRYKKSVAIPVHGGGRGHFIRRGGRV
jgi:hypothetical protein